MNKTRLVSFSHYSKLYGANRSLLSLIEKTQSQIDWLVITREHGEFYDKLKSLGIKCYVIPFKIDTSPVSSSFIFIKGIFKLLYNLVLLPIILYRVLQFKADIVHSNSSIIFIGIITSIFLNLKHVWHIREYGKLDYKITFSLGLKTFIFLANRSDLILCISNSIRKELINLNNINSECFVIYNGVNIKNNKILNYEHNYSGRKVLKLIIAGIIQPGKNQLVAVKALKLLNDRGFEIELYVVGGIGESNYYNEIITYIYSNDLQSKVYFTGYKSNISRYLSNCDISLVCSSNEAFGRISIESQLNKIPVVAFGSGGTLEIIDNGVNGLLYYGDENELSEQIVKLLKDNDLRHKIIDNGYSNAKEKFSEEKDVNEFLLLIEKLVYGVQ